MLSPYSTSPSDGRVQWMPSALTAWQTRNTLSRSPMPRYQSRNPRNSSPTRITEP
jgi:hypothetical protein